MTGTTPVPPIVSVVMANGVLVVNVKIALVVIAATGVNVTGRLQVAFGATGAAHSVVSTVKRGLLETAEVSVNRAVPQFVRMPPEIGAPTVRPVSYKTQAEAGIAG